MLTLSISRLITWKPRSSVSISVIFAFADAPVLAILQNTQEFKTDPNFVLYFVRLFSMFHSLLKDMSPQMVSKCSKIHLLDP